MKEPDRVVTFETVRKAAKSTGEITYDFNCDIEQDNGQITPEFQKKRDEEWCRKIDVGALQTQLQEWLKRLDEPPMMGFDDFEKWIEEGKKLLGCVEAKEK